MNRKTNIFYNTDSEDSRFITFNNYSEALTGDILAVDYKLWPSRFICLYIDELDIKNLTLPEDIEDTLENRELIYNRNKSNLIHLLEQYYENKLAVLRDNSNNLEELKPFNYLIDLLYYFVYNIKNQNNKIQNIYDIEKKIFENEDNILSLIDFNYISDIVEQQYNGTYSDIICTINPHNWYKPVIKFVDSLDFNINDNAVEITNNECLYGWENTIDGEEGSNQHKIYEIVHKSPIKDNELNSKDIYYIKSFIDYIKIELNNDNSNKLKFNLLIPLFNLINTSNENDINDVEENDMNIVLSNKVNVPLGLYFTDNTIELNIDNKYATNWSVLISTQFSAFPFSFDIQQNFDNSQTDKQAYLTFAEILANQTNMISLFNKYDSTIKSLQNRIIMLESKINNISSLQNIDELSKSIVNLKNNQIKMQSDFEDQLDDLKKLINEVKLTWQVKTKS